MLDRPTGETALYPEDIDVLSGVFDQLCALLQLEPATGRAELVAADLVHLYQGGVTNPATLLATISRQEHAFELAS
jgi:hypothetical protein